MLENLIKLMQENPELPVVPMVRTEVVPDSDYYTYWLASFGSVQIDKYISYTFYSEDKIVFYEDKDEIEEYLADKFFNMGYSDEEVDEAVKEEMNNLEWIEAIIVYIEEALEEEGN